MAEAGAARIPHWPRRRRAISAVRSASLSEGANALLHFSGRGAERLVLRLEFEPFFVPGEHDPQDWNGEDHDDCDEGNQRHEQGGRLTASIVEDV